ncbi:MAG TPA: prepilin peptidase [Mollicutes bacterium]|nr:prepilin peptidase [Mollicutes bacterium]
MTIELLYATLFFILGIIMGSFYNVVGYRLPNNISLIKPSSHCPNCNKKLGFFELIPIISYIIQFGKCKKCKQRISIFYPIIELSSGLLFALSYLVFGLTSELFVALVFSSTLLIVILTDIKYMIISDEVLLFSGIMIIIGRLMTDYEITALLLNIIIPFMFLLIVKISGDFFFKKESLGGGDVKLMIVIGLALGWQTSIITVAFASFIALPISLVILAVKKTNVIPFGPFLSLASLILYYFSIDFTVIFNLLVNV